MKPIQAAEMKEATRLSACALGVYAGLLGVEHGFFEILQGDGPTNGFLINALELTCQPEVFWHACFPALTFIPSFRISRIFASLLGMSVSIWADGFVHRKQGGLILFLLTALMLPVGGGFVPVFIGISAGLAKTRIHSPLNGWQRLSPKVIETLSRFWPWMLVLLMIWFPASWIAGLFFQPGDAEPGSASIFVF